MLVCRPAESTGNPQLKLSPLSLSSEADAIQQFQRSIASLHVPQASDVVSESDREAEGLMCMLREGKGRRRKYSRASF